jgi:hypothetical protein
MNSLKLIIFSAAKMLRSIEHLTKGKLIVCTKIQQNSQTFVNRCPKIGEEKEYYNHATISSFDLSPVKKLSLSPSTYKMMQRSDISKK